MGPKGTQSLNTYTKGMWGPDFAITHYTSDWETKAKVFRAICTLARRLAVLLETAEESDDSDMEASR